MSVITINRKTLYDEIWKEASVAAAARNLNISYLDLLKVVHEYKIPHPDNNYQMRLRLGKEVSGLQLPFTGDPYKKINFLDQETAQRIKNQKIIDREEKKREEESLYDKIKQLYNKITVIDELINYAQKFFESGKIFCDDDTALIDMEEILMAQIDAAIDEHILYNKTKLNIIGIDIDAEPEKQVIHIPTKEAVHYYLETLVYTTLARSPYVINLYFLHCTKKIQMKSNLLGAAIRSNDVQFLYDIKHFFSLYIIDNCIPYTIFMDYFDKVVSELEEQYINHPSAMYKYVNRLNIQSEGTSIYCRGIKEPTITEMIKIISDFKNHVLFLFPNDFPTDDSILKTELRSLNVSYSRREFNKNKIVTIEDFFYKIEFIHMMLPNDFYSLWNAIKRLNVSTSQKD